MAVRRCLPILSLILLLAAACDRPPHESPPGPEAPPKAGLDKDGAAGTGVRLALLEPSNDMLMATLEGVLHADGRCLYIVGKDPKRNRTLPAFHIAGMRWDEATRTLRVRGKSFSPGQRVVLGGGHVPNHPALDWLQRPDPSCDSSDLFMAGTIDAAKASPRR